MVFPFTSFQVVAQWFHTLVDFHVTDKNKGKFLLCSCFFFVRRYSFNRQLRMAGRIGLGQLFENQKLSLLSDVPQTWMFTVLILCKKSSQSDTCGHDTQSSPRQAARKLHHIRGKHTMAALPKFSYRHLVLPEQQFLAQNDYRGKNCQASVTHSSLCWGRHSVFCQAFPTQFLCLCGKKNYPLSDRPQVSWEVCSLTLPTSSWL